MIKKIIGILLCMLMMSTATIVAGIASEQKKVDDQLLTIDDDVPTWEIGNSWTYAGELFVDEEGVN